MSRISLDQLRETILANQAKGEKNPSAPIETIVVDRDANIQLASNITPDQGREVVRVQQDIFHNRTDQEQDIVRRFFPTNTQHKTVNELSGWHYSFTCEFKTRYEMFAYFDGSYYQVIVLSPAVEQRYQSAHTGHIFGDGNICFGVDYGSGRPTLADAYAKSVLWANGFSAMLLSGNNVFPFSLNNQ